MKIFNPIGISITLGFHLLFGGVLLFTQGCQSNPKGKPEAVTPPPIIPAAELGTQSRNRQWDDKRLSEPTRPAWATEQQVETLADSTVWNPVETQTPVDSPQLDELVWSDPVQSAQQGQTATPDQTEATGQQPEFSQPVAQRTYTIVRGDTLSGIARDHGISVRALVEANNLTAASVIRPGQELRIPGAESSSAGTTVAGASSQSDIGATVHADTSYTVKAGDSLSRIAKRHGVSVSALKAANGLTGDMIRIGQVLLIPGGGSATATAQSGESAAPRRTTPVQSSASTVLAEGQTITHKVKGGEVLSVIARRYGTTVAQIKQDNNIRDERRVQIGQELVIRSTKAPAAPSGSGQTPAAGTTGESLRDRVPSTGTTTSSSPSTTTPPAPQPSRPVENEPLVPEENNDMDELERIISEGTANPIRD